MKLHTKILLGLVAGATVGTTVNLATGGGPATQRLVTLVTEPVGRMWLSALIMVVIPLIFSTLAMGVVGLGDVRRLGRIGLVTLLCFVGLTTLSTILGLTVMNTVAPGRSLDPAVKAELMETYKGETKDAMGLAGKSFSIELLTSIVPRNPIKAAAEGNMLGIIFVALVVGVALTLLPDSKGAPMKAFLDSMGHVTVAIIEMVMKLGPIGVFCLIFSATARFGFHLLLSLAKFVIVVIGSLAFFQVVAYSLVLLLISRWNPLEFFKKAKLVMLTAFSTSSSNATLPTTIRVAEKSMGMPPEIAGFVLPLGATMNMNGTSLFEGATVLFLAQVFGVNLSLGTQVIVVVMAVITAIGTAGIPGGSIPLLMMVLAMVGVPPEGIAIVLGVDRILDMCRTVLNVTGDMVTATVVMRVEGIAPHPDPLAEEM
jgi:dicarboxylate/amino acid:cation (Na+ or H+) symporter, DAACS family